MSISSPNNTLHPDGTVKIRKAKNLWKPSDWAQANMSVEWSLPLHKCLVVGFPKQLSVLDHSHGLPPSLATSSLFSSLVPLLHPLLNDRGTSFLDPSSLPSPHICVCVCVSLFRYLIRVSLKRQTELLNPILSRLSWCFPTSENSTSIRLLTQAKSLVLLASSDPHPIHQQVH